MNKNPLVVWLIALSISIVSCAETEKEKITRLVRGMEGKEIVFPDNIVYTVYGTDTVDYIIPEREYTIVSYVDSIGCTSCKLQLYRWKEFMNEVDSLSDKSVSFRFIFHPKDKKELHYLFKRDRFDFPVWIDVLDDFNRTNRLPELDRLHTFLLNSEGKVVAIGNPVNNPKIKELYYKIILCTETLEDNIYSRTQIECKNTVIDMGEFGWEEAREKNIKIKNIGSNMLFINDVIASCGCINVTYSHKPVEPGSELEIIITYKSENPEFFNKTLKVFTNSDINPLELTLKGVSR